MVKVNAEPCGSIAVTKKGGFIRKFLMLTQDGKKHVKSVFSNNRSDLEGDNARPLVVEPGDLVFLVK